MPQLRADITVTIEAPARLHLGFLDLDATIGRRYGSIGLAIDHPSTRLELSPLSGGTAHVASQAVTSDGALQNQITGAEVTRAEKALSRFQRDFGIGTPMALRVASAIPAHAGLGSGTQLAIAIGTAVAHLAGRPLSARDVGERLERGARSAIGMAAFETGGFLVDGGRRTTSTGDHAAPIVSRLPFPDDWRIILIVDRETDGVHGEKETTAFANLPPMPRDTAAHLCHLTLMKLLPALAEADIVTFGSAVGEIQATVGRQFAPYQGGDIWASKRVGAFVRRLADAGAAGMGQSSWGPTGFVFTATRSAAEALTTRFAADAAEQDLDLVIVKGRNSGAKITETALARTH